MSTPAAKRRRMEAATSTLSKPFRSPLKSPFKAHSASNHSTQPSIPTTLETSPFVRSEEVSNLAVSPVETPHRALGTKKTLSPAVSVAAQLNTDPEITQLLRTQRELEKQLREVKEQVETAEQAKRIERESQKLKINGEIDSELVVLIEKWKGASRQAAEELFVKVRDRVNQMGGPRAWKEMQKKQQEFQSSWDQQEQPNGDPNEVNAEVNVAEKRDLYAEYSIDVETDNEKSQRVKATGDTGEILGQEDQFTMAMMLRTLNVDLEIIGYDKERQGWSD